MSKKPRYISRVEYEQIQEQEEKFQHSPQQQPDQEPSRHWSDFWMYACIAGGITMFLSVITWGILGANDISLKQTVERLGNTMSGNTAQAQFAAYVKPVEANGYSPQLLETLRTTGLANSKTYSKYLAMADKPVIDKYRELTGLQFVSQQFLTNIHKTTGLMVAETHRFKGEIPAENIMEMNEGLKKLDNIFGHEPKWSGMYWRSNGWDIDKITSCTICQKEATDPTNMAFHSPFKDKQLFILAKPSELNLEGTRTENGFVFDRDPAVLLKVPEGYLILTVWE